MKRLSLALSALALVALALPARADLTKSLKKGNPDIQAIGTMTFGPEGVLFIGDPKTATIFAIGTGDTKAEAGELKLDNVNEKIASQLGVESSQLRINDMAVNPASGAAYLGVTRGRGGDAQPVLIRVGADAKATRVELKDVPFASVKLENAKTNDQRTEAITCLGFVKDKLYVASLANEEFASNLRAIPFPFEKADTGAGIRIYHGAHGAFETRSPVRTFTALDINGQTHLMAAYQCTPLVKIPVGDLKAGAKVNGTTVAELGNRNRPLDMIVYEKDGKTFLLIANNARGVMKVPTEGIDKAAGIEKPVRGGTGTAGVKYETVSDLKNVVQLAKLNDKSAVILVQEREGPASLKTIALP